MIRLLRNDPATRPNRIFCFDGLDHFVDQFVFRHLTKRLQNQHIWRNKIETILSENYRMNSQFGKHLMLYNRSRGKIVCRSNFIFNYFLFLIFLLNFMIYFLFSFIFPFNFSVYIHKVLLINLIFLILSKLRNTYICSHYFNIQSFKPIFQCLSFSLSPCTATTESHFSWSSQSSNFKLQFFISSQIVLFKEIIFCPNSISILDLDLVICLLLEPLLKAKVRI